MANIQNITEAIEALKNVAAGLPVAISVDTTLTQSGQAADAKATGDALATKAESSHNHAATEITSGTLSVARGGTGNTSVDTTPTSGSTKMVTSGGVYTALSGKAASSHNQAASTVTAGTFAGAVVAQTSSQAPATSLLRNSKLVTTDTNPSYNGEICWTYA